MSINYDTGEEDRWNKIFRELTKDLTPKQTLVYSVIYKTYWDLGGIFLNTIPYDEVVIRSSIDLDPHRKRLEKDLRDAGGKEEYKIIIDEICEKKGKEVKDIIEELCAKGFVSCHTIRFGDGVTEEVSKPTKVLIMRDYDRRVLLHEIDRIILKEKFGVQF